MPWRYNSCVLPFSVPVQTGHRCGGAAGEAMGGMRSCDRLMAATPLSQGVHKPLHSGQKNHWVKPGQSRSRWATVFGPTYTEAGRN